MNVILNKIKIKILNNKVLTKNIFGVIILKGISLLISFLMTPMYLSYFSNQSILGVWYTIQSILLWILTFDLGIGNGIRNRLAKDIATRDYLDARKTVSSGYIILALVTVIITSILVIIIPMFNWNIILNTDISSNILSKILFITIIGIILQFFFKIVSSILMALRKNVLANSLPLFTNIIILTFLITYNKGDDYNRFIFLATVYSMATIIPLIISTIYVFCGKFKNIRPSFKFWDKNIAFEVLKVGGSFFAIQLGLLIVNSTNQVLINYIFAGEAVVEYTLYYSLFSLAPMIFTLFTQPVWSEISVKYAIKDYEWIKNIRKMMNFLALLISLGCVIICMLLPVIFRIWLGSENYISPNYLVGFLFVIWCTVELFIYSSTCIANGMTKLKCQAKYTTLAAIIKIPTTFMISIMLNHWIGIIVAHIISLVPLLIVQNIDLNKTLSNDIVEN